MILEDVRKDLNIILDDFVPWLRSKMRFELHVTGKLLFSLKLANVERRRSLGRNYTDLA